MTQSFISAYERNPGATYSELLAAVHKQLKKRGFSQRPQLTSSQKFNVQGRRFSFVEGIEPNRNEKIGRMKRRHVRPGRIGGGNPRLNEILFGSNFGKAAVGLAMGAALLL